MKKILTALIICVLLMGIIFNTTACATNPREIQPDNNQTIVLIPSSQPTPTDNSGFVVVEPSPTNNSNGFVVIDPSSPTTIVIPSPETRSALAEDLFILVNQARMDAELQPVIYDYDLQEAADLRAKEASISFSHTRPNGQDCFTVFPDYYAAGENLAVADIELADAETIMNLWMYSEGHKANILNDDFTGMAIGRYESDGIVYVSQLFIG